MNRITCEVCGSNDLIKQDSVFLCQVCGCKYSLEEAKKLIVEITNPVQILGVDNADTLYNRALEWLSLQNEKKAIEVLKKMIERYPGDKRSWQKLARLTPRDNSIIENALKFGDDELLAEMEAAAEMACADFRNKNGKKWLQTYPLALKEMYASDVRVDFFLETDKYYSLISCTKELLEEGRKKASYFNRLWRAFLPNGTSRPHYYEWIMQELLSQKVEKISRASLRCFSARIIVGNMIYYTYDDIDYYRSGALFFHDVLTESAIQQIFDEVEYLRTNKLCPYCGNKRTFSLFTASDSCPKCKRPVPWFES